MAAERVTIDLVTKLPGDAGFALVLVEEGPWRDVEAELRRLQDRLYSCIDVAIDGELSRRFPATNGMPVCIRVDCYDLDDPRIDNFLRRFAEHIATDSETTTAIRQQGFVSNLRFEFNYRRLEPRADTDE